jgi:hypothetical protein
MMYEHKDEPLLNKEKFTQRLWRNILLAALLIAISLLVGMGGYHYFGELPWIDSFLNASMILTGMGPVDRMNCEAGKLFAAFYSLFSGIAFLTTIGVILAPLLHRGMHKFHISNDNE